VRRRAVLDDLVGALREPGDALAERICRSVASALDVTWVRLVVDGRIEAVVGTPGQAVVSVSLQAGGADEGVLECGPRRGGWSAAEVGQLDAIATPAALALREAALTRELTARVAELTASRSRLVQVEQQVRVQIERDLHDGLQQQLVALLARLAVIREYLDAENLDAASPAGAALGAAHELAGQSLRDLRTLVAGLHPVLLSDRGLVAAVQARADLLPIPVAVDADPRIATRRFPLEVEGAAFFVVSEALANVLKHSGSAHARVVLAPHDGGLRVAVADEGSGTARYSGSGLRGLRDRVEALGGHFDLQSTLDVGTTVVADFLVDAPVVARV
jgi:signal transduction histidine kinase